MKTTIEGITLTQEAVEHLEGAYPLDMEQELTEIAAEEKARKLRETALGDFAGFSALQQGVTELFEHLLYNVDKK